MPNLRLNSLVNAVDVGRPSLQCRPFGKWSKSIGDSLWARLSGKRPSNIGDPPIPPCFSVTLNVFSGCSEPIGSEESRFPWCWACPWEMCGILRFSFSNHNGSVHGSLKSRRKRKINKPSDVLHLLWTVLYFDRGSPHASTAHLCLFYITGYFHGIYFYKIYFYGYILQQRTHTSS